MENKIDLHIHTNISDGKHTPFEIIDMAVENNVKTIAIADHDSVDAYTKEFFDYANFNNIEIITAVEISTKLNNISIHILGYDIDINNEELKKELEKQRNSRFIYLKEVSNKLNQLGYVVNLEKLSKIDGVTKNHIAKDVVFNELNKDVLFKKYSYIPAAGEFIETILNYGCPAFVKKHTLTPKKASKLIKNASGKVVLAHPVVYNSKDNLSVNQIKEILVEINADGIEANYIYINKRNEFINQIFLWNNVAKELNIFTTIGSDFHELDNINANIGLINYEEVFTENKLT